MREAGSPHTDGPATSAPRLKRHLPQPPLRRDGGRSGLLGFATKLLAEAPPLG